jgi:monovalent cation:H+ antiporter-2, CPA2 family
MYKRNMDHNLTIVTILTIGFVLASLFAYIAQRLNLPTILGYLFAGYIVGPYSPGYVAEMGIADQLAEIGVILMLFGVGLHFKLENLISVKYIAIPGAIGQTLAATICATFFVYLAGWSITTGLIIGLSIGVASTVVAVRMLSERHLLNALEGHIAIGWVVVEDIFTVIILIMLPSIAAFSQGMGMSVLSIAGEIFFALAKFAVLALFMFTWGQRIIAYALTKIAQIRSQELFTLTVLAVVFLIATGSSFIFGMSIALGAFIAGMVIGKTNVRHQASANALPLKDVFAVVFFLSIGMLFNPMAIPANLTLFLGITFVIVIIKPLVAYLITVIAGYPIKVALTVAITLAQIGEFSFILAVEALSLKLLPDEGYDILVACALVSISINPLLFQALDFFEKILKKVGFSRKYHHGSEKLLKKKKLLPKVVLIGYGPIGKEVSIILKHLSFMPLIIEQNIDTVSEKEEKDFIIFGDASDVHILRDAKIEEAGHLIITIPELSKTLDIIRSARQINPSIQIITRIQFISEIPKIEELNVQYVCTEREALKTFASLIHHHFKHVKS